MGTLAASGDMDAMDLFPVFWVRVVIWVPTIWETTSPITDIAISSSSMFSSLFMRLARLLAVSSDMRKLCSPGKPEVKSAFTTVTISGSCWRKASRLENST